MFKTYRGMSIIYFLITISILIAIVFLITFILAVKNGQFDDLEGPAYRILMDDDDPRIPSKTTNQLRSTKEQAEKTDKSA